MANYVKFRRGTPEQYNSLPHKDSDTLYFIAESNSLDGALYLGSKLIAGGTDGVYSLSLDDLSDIIVDAVKDGQLLVYNNSLGSWINTNIEEVIGIFDSGGVPGLVPAPEVGQTNAFLRSDGTWCEIGSTTETIITITNDNSEAHNEILNKISSPVNDDILIIKDLITNDKYQHTAYIYNGIDWEAMSGNYSAENVYFKNDFVFTEAVGTVDIPSSGSTVVAAAGKNVKEFLSSLFAEEKNPIITQPGADIVPTSTITTYEVGQIFTPGYSIRFYGGNYQYDTSTGVTKVSQQIYDSRGQVSTQSSTSFTPVEVEDDCRYYIYGSVSYSDGNIPTTNLGNPYEEGQIKANTIQANASKIVTGHRKSFYGTLDKKTISLTSSDIRNLHGKSSDALSNGSSFALNIPVGAMRTIVAYPATLRDLTSVKDVNAQSAEIVSSFKKYSINVEGYNGYEAIEYKVYVLDYAYPLPTSNVYQVII